MLLVVQKRYFFGTRLRAELDEETKSAALGSGGGGGGGLKSVSRGGESFEGNIDGLLSNPPDMCTLPHVRVQPLHCSVNYMAQKCTQGRRCSSLPCSS